MSTIKKSRIPSNNSTSTIETLRFSLDQHSSTIKILSIPEYKQCVNHRNTLYPKVPTVRQASKYSIPQSTNSTSTIKKLGSQVKRVRQRSKYVISQSMKSTLTTKILSIPKYQEYVNHKNT